MIYALYLDFKMFFKSKTSKNIKVFFKDKKNKEIEKLRKDNEELQEAVKAVRYFKDLKDDYDKKFQRSLERFTLLVNQDIFTDTNSELIDLIRKKHEEIMEDCQKQKEYEQVRIMDYQKWLS